MTNQEVYEIVKENKEHNEKVWEKQQEQNEKVIDILARHDEKIKGMWKVIPISGGLVTFIGAIFTIINMFLL